MVACEATGLTFEENAVLKAAYYWGMRDGSVRATIPAGCGGVKGAPNKKSLCGLSARYAGWKAAAG